MASASPSRRASARSGSAICCATWTTKPTEERELEAEPEHREVGAGQERRGAQDPDIGEEVREQREQDERPGLGPPSPREPAARPPERRQRSLEQSELHARRHRGHEREERGRETGGEWDRERGQSGDQRQERDRPHERIRDVGQLEPTQGARHRPAADD
jgi:hypothetical protein